MGNDRYTKAFVRNAKLRILLTTSEHHNMLESKYFDCETPDSVLLASLGHQIVDTMFK